jgi:hypothetical protein
VPIHCSRCASEIPESSAYCRNCGTWAAPPPPEAPPSTPGLGEAEDPKGLSGWLALVGFGLVVAPFVILGISFALYLPILSSDKYKASLAADPLAADFIAFDVVTKIVFIAGLLVLNHLFFNKKKAFRPIMIFFLVAQLAVTLFEAIATHLLFPSANPASLDISIVQSLIGVLIWVPYFTVSRRVKATFVY